MRKVIIRRNMIMTSVDNKTAIVVDDVTLMRAVLKEHLKKIGFSVVAEASDGKEAIEKCQAHSPDLVTMDLSMPGMEGVEVIEAIRIFDKEVKIVVISAAGFQKNVIEAISAGANNFIVKPFKENKMLEVVDALFNEG